MRRFDPIGIFSGSYGAGNKTMKNKGVTLIEMLAAVAIFAITVGAISGTFISAIRSQRRVLATQELLDQTSYVLEYMGRALRMAKKDTAGSCLTTCGAGCNYENPGGNVSQIKFLKHDIETDTDICYWFFLENNQIKESKNGALPGVVLTSAKLTVNSLKFNLSGESGSDTLQPRVTIFLKILGRGTTERPEIQIQTSISQRPLDVP